jgi:hypothetical protein
VNNLVVLIAAYIVTDFSISMEAAQVFGLTHAVSVDEQIGYWSRRWNTIAFRNLKYLA